jgi:Domain of unknown function (DUF4381)
MNEPASAPDLSKLHDFYQPPPPAWTPQTVGWYVLFAIIAVALIGCVIYWVHRYIADRYRREALRELDAASPEQFSALLKRTALAAWPREQVASLSGDAWLKFLQQTSPSHAFEKAPANRVEEISVRTVTLSTNEVQDMRIAAAEWIRRHRVHA